MSWLTLLAGPLTKLIERIFPDKEAQDKAKAEMMTIMANAQAQEMRAKADVVVSEAKGESWLQRNWRPMTMLIFIIIVANNFIIVPYLGAFGIVVPALDIPPQMWYLLTIGIGGYIAGRSAEKIAAKKFHDKEFFDSVREQYGNLNQQDVDRLNKALDEGFKDGK